MQTALIIAGAVLWLVQVPYAVAANRLWKATVDLVNEDRPAGERLPYTWYQLPAPKPVSRWGFRPFVLAEYRGIRGEDDLLRRWKTSVNTSMSLLFAGLVLLLIGIRLH